MNDQLKELASLRAKRFDRNPIQSKRPVNFLEDQQKFNPEMTDQLKELAEMRSKRNVDFVEDQKNILKKAQKFDRLIKNIDKELNIIESLFSKLNKKLTKDFDYCIEDKGIIIRLNNLLKRINTKSNLTKTDVLDGLNTLNNIIVASNNSINTCFEELSEKTQKYVELDKVLTLIKALNDYSGDEVNLIKEDKLTKIEDLKNKSKSFIQEINTIKANKINQIKNLIITFFSVLSDRSKNITDQFNYVEYNKLITTIQDKYRQVFNEELPVQSEILMDTTIDEDLAYDLYLEEKKLLKDVEYEFFE